MEAAMPYLNGAWTTLKEAAKPRKEDLQPGRTTCLRCSKVFQSWDIRANRRCPQCRYAVDSESNEGGVF
jgi:predicted Zn-ribbon and HTH transcriptional regulator